MPAVLQLTQGAQLKLEGSACVNAQGNANGVLVPKDAKLTVSEEAQILGGRYANLVIAADAQVQLQGGTLADGGVHNIINDGTLQLSGGTVSGAAAGAGVLVAQLADCTYVVAKDGYWHNLNNTRYQIDGADVAFNAADSANGYGLGATATVFDTDANGNSRLAGAQYGVFSAGAVAADSFQQETVQSLVVNTLTSGTNAYDHKTSFEEAYAYAQTLEGDQTISFSSTLQPNTDTGYIIALSQKLTHNKSTLTSRLTALSERNR